MAVLRRLRVGHLLRLCRQRSGITRLEGDGEGQSRRVRCRSDKSGSGRYQALMAWQLLSPRSGGCGTRRGRGAERGSEGQHDCDLEHVRDDMVQPTFATSIHLHPRVLTGPPRLGRLILTTRSIRRPRGHLRTRPRALPFVVPMLSAPEVPGLRGSARQSRDPNQADRLGRKDVAGKTWQERRGRKRCRGDRTGAAAADSDDGRAASAGEFAGVLGSVVDSGAPALRRPSLRRSGAPSGGVRVPEDPGGARAAGQTAVMRIWLTRPSTTTYDGTGAPRGEARSARWHDFAPAGPSYGSSDWNT